MTTWRGVSRFLSVLSEHSRSWQAIVESKMPNARQMLCRLLLDDYVLMRARRSVAIGLELDLTAFLTEEVRQCIDNVRRDLISRDVLVSTIKNLLVEACPSGLGSKPCTMRSMAGCQ